MARRSLKPQLNQIRAWVQQGRTDAWIAHQLEVTVAELSEFRNQHGLKPDGESAPSTEIELRDEIEAEVEAATADEVEEPEEAPEEKEAEEAPEEKEADEADEDVEAAEAKQPAAEPKDGESAEARPRRRRRRGRRGGRGRRRDFEATFDHGERDGYGLWLDASVRDNPVYTENWAGKREVSVRIEPDQIVIRRAGEDDSSSDD